MRTSADHAEYDYHAGPPDEMEQVEQIAAEIAELEREIGRAVIACRDTESIMQDYESRLSLGSAEMANYRAAEKRIIQQESELDALIARWRRLHAEGAE